jgi:hypothetical protein
MGFFEETIGQELVLRGARWSTMADTLEAKRVDGARTRMMPIRIQKERANNFVRPETASVMNGSD